MPLLKKNPNTCKLIGVHESYSVYKWRYIYWIFFFILVMVGILTWGGKLTVTDITNTVISANESSSVIKTPSVHGASEALTGYQ
ncbi:unnamed protein product [Staurois parvus]|uniref:Uncharacterized protein n=1 Tax=Staurois parvus TaxID=386267 RepID=A0ABN9D2P0_9NEOB|nr:unnamed protein product [Staurois parvus]